MRGWPHAPSREVTGTGTYIVTGATLQKSHLFQEPSDLEFLHDLLLSELENRQWQVEAWAVFSNHYHFVGTSPDESDVATFVRRFHAKAGIELNKRHETPGRKVLYSYWQTRLTFDKSYLARLNYVHQNPVKHGLVKVARDYRWCSAAWFEDRADRAWYETVSSFPVDRVNVVDDF